MLEIYKKLLEDIFISGNRYDELESIIENLEREALQEGNNNIYDIYYDINSNEFDVWEFTDPYSHPASDDLIFIGEIEERYNDEFWGDFEEDDYYTAKDAINDTIYDGYLVEFKMNDIKERIENEISWREVQGD